MNLKNKFNVMDHVLDNDIEPLVVHVSADTEGNSYDLDEEGGFD